MNKNRLVQGLSALFCLCFFLSAMLSFGVILAHEGHHHDSLRDEQQCAVCAALHAANTIIRGGSLAAAGVCLSAAAALARLAFAPRERAAARVSLLELKVRLND